jgi:hypothetical protein
LRLFFDDFEIVCIPSFIVFTSHFSAIFDFRDRHLHKF